MRGTRPARGQLAARLPVIERALGPGHPQTLTISFDIAYWASRQTVTSGWPELAPAFYLRTGKDSGPVTTAD
jgi:hypothetical protein